MKTHSLFQGSMNGLRTAADVIPIRYRRRGIHAFHVAAVTLFVLAMPAAAYAAPAAGGLGAGRLLPTLAAVAGLAGVIIGRRALVRSRRSVNARTGAVVAAVLGLVSLTIGVLHAANAAGTFGTGNGLAGAVVAMALGLAAIIVGGIALSRAAKNIATAPDKE